MSASFRGRLIAAPTIKKHVPARADRVVRPYSESALIAVGRDHWARRKSDPCA